MPTSGYTDAAFKMGAFNMPSNFKSDYKQGTDGLWYFKGGGGNGGAAAPSASSGGRAAQGAAAGAEANRLVRAGEDAIGAATGAAASNLADVRGILDRSNAQVNADLNAARGAGASMDEAAGKLGGFADKVNKTAQEVGDTADIFSQYAASMERDSTYARANALPWLETGNDMLNMDESAGGMAGEWAKLYKQMSPDALAAGAASSTRKAAATAEGDMLRSMARRGISAGSGAVAAALGKQKEREEASVAAMMTSARKVGLSMQADALKSGFAMALQASGMGKQFADEALAAEMAATDAQGKATAALATKGSLQSQAASIVASQGNMFAARGNLALGIASTVSNNTASNISGLNAATNTMINSQAVAADYYSTQGGSILSMLTQQHYNVMSALFGSAIPATGK